MIIQEQIINPTYGNEYWKIYFEIDHYQKITIEQWYEIYDIINDYLTKKNDKD